MNLVEHSILQQHYKLRKLVKIWRALARERAEALAWVVEFHNHAERQRTASCHGSDIDLSAELAELQTAFADIDACDNQKD